MVSHDGYSSIVVILNTCRNQQTLQNPHEAHLVELSGVTIGKGNVHDVYFLMLNFFNILTLLNITEKTILRSEDESNNCQ